VSLLLVYHDKNRALAVSDARAIDFDSEGKAVPKPGCYPKFAFLPNDAIFAALGPAKTCSSFKTIASSLVTMNRGVTVPMLPDVLSRIFREKWAKREPNPNLPTKNDHFDSALLGYDAQQRRIRSYMIASYENFRPIETTSDPNARIFALGAYGLCDYPALQSLTARMQNAHKRDLYWIATQLRDTLNGFHGKDAIRIGPPSFFGALDCHGRVRLPSTFPPPPEITVPTVGRHFVTQEKGTAMAGQNRFFLGSIFTPAQGGPDTVGNGDGGTVVAPGTVLHLRPTTSGVSNIGNGVVSNISNMYDSDQTDCGTLSISGNAGGNTAVAALYGVPAIGNFPTCQVAVDWEVPTNNLNTSGQPVFWIQVGVHGQMGTFVTIPGTSLNAGQTQSRIKSTYVLPAGMSLGVVEIDIEAAISTGTTSGSLTANIYDVRIECMT
jgi:hypothetical protein